jgi:hypothetical protein
MKKLFFIFTLCMVAVLTKATSPVLPIDWNFIFSSTAYITATNTLETGSYTSSSPGKWYAGGTLGAGTSSPFVEPNGLSYSNYVDNNAGEDIILLSTAAAARNSFFAITNVTSLAGGGYTDGSYYLSFLINVTAAPASSVQFVEFDKGVTGQRGRTYIIQTSATGFALGTTPGSVGPVYPANFTGELSYGTTHLIVLKYKLSASALTLDSYVYVDPVVGAAEPATPTVQGIQATYSSDYLRGFDVCQQPGLAYKVGGFRFSTSYSDVNKVFAITLPAPDVSAGGTNVSSAGFTANWAAVANASSYDVRVYDASSAQVGSTVNVPVGTLSLDITGLNPNATYSYTVTAIGDHILYLDSPASAASAPVSTLVTGLKKIESEISVLANNKVITCSESGLIQVYNLQGANLLQAQNVNKLATTLESGLYIVRFTSNNGQVISTKVMIR